jgi:hypothetical protein
MRAHPSRLDLDLLFVGSAPDATRAHVESCERCSRELALMHRMRDELLAAHPHPPRIERSKTPWLAAIAATILIGAVLLVPRDRPERAKGSTIVDLWVNRGGEAFLFEHQPLSRGDTLVFRYTSARRFLIVVDVERSGKISPVIAGPDGASIPIEAGSKKTAPQGLRLDDYRGRERVIAIFSDEKVESERLTALVRERFERLTPEDRDRLELGVLGLGDEASWLISKEP